MWWCWAAFCEALAEVIKMPSASCQDLLVFSEMETAPSFVSRDELIYVKQELRSEILCFLADLYQTDQHPA